MTERFKFHPSPTRSWRERGAIITSRRPSIRLVSGTNQIKDHHSTEANQEQMTTLLV